MCGLILFNKNLKLHLALICSLSFKNNAASQVISALVLNIGCNVHVIKFDPDIDLVLIVITCIKLLVWWYDKIIINIELYPVMIHWRELRMLYTLYTLHYEE